MEGQEPNTISNANTGANNEPAGAQTNEPKAQTFDEILTNKEYQSEFDKRVQKAINTAQTDWEQIHNDELSEADKLAKMNETQRLQYQLKKEQNEKIKFQKQLSSRDLKDEAIKIATTQDTAFDPEFLNLFDFENMTAEDLQKKTKTLKVIQDRIVEKTINQWSKEKPPYNPNQDSQLNNETQLAQAFGNTN